MLVCAHIVMTVFLTTFCTTNDVHMMLAVCVCPAVCLCKSGEWGEIGVRVRCH